jgi:nucleotide-binding universal stress UspA family protein
LPIYRRILVVVDGSEDSIRAGEHAVYLAQSVGAELIVLGVVGIDPRLAARRGICFVGVGPDLELERRSAVPSVRELAAANGVKCSEWRGTPSWEIVTKAVEKVRADRVVVGSWRASEASAAFTAERFSKSLERAGRPVLRV